MTSDEFFHSYTGEKFDVVLIDGIHSEEQVDKDIENSLNNLAENGIIFLDDCNPPTELHAKERPFYDVPYNGQWNGLVYRSLMKIRFDRQDLNVESYDTEWGLAAIKKEKSNSLICDGKLSWDFFNENRNQILNFKSFEDFFNSNNVKSYKISLCMIVKNEAKIIKRCLDSVKPLIDYVFIVDTGSDDDTINVINDWLLQNKMDGKVISEPWKDFAYNRSFAMSELRKMKNIEYVFMIDADEILNFDKNINIQKIKNNLVKDLYSIRCNYGKIQYLKNSITKNSKPFCYKGVLHEFIDCQNELFTNDIIEGIYNIPIQDSARNKSIDKYKKDVEVLENEIKIEKNKEMLSRYYFYLAQSYRDCNEKEKAMHWYKERVKSGGWIQEIYYSLYQIARLKEMLQYPEDEIIQSYMIAFESLPQRIEAIFGAVLFCRKVNRFNQAYILAKYAQTIPKVYEGLFVENWIYEFAIEDELSVCCYHVGKFKEGKELTQKLISKVPEEHKKRFIHNLDEYNKKLNHNGLNI
jgi:glycosyltransferase involved in cell wall biosynthesis